MESNPGGYEFHLYLGCPPLSWSLICQQSAFSNLLKFQLNSPRWCPAAPAPVTQMLVRYLHLEVPVFPSVSAFLAALRPTSAL